MSDVKIQVGFTESTESNFLPLQTCGGGPACSQEALQEVWKGGYSVASNVVQPSRVNHRMIVVWIQYWSPVCSWMKTCPPSCFVKPEPTVLVICWTRRLKLFESVLCLCCCCFFFFWGAIFPTPKGASLIFLKSFEASISYENAWSLSQFCLFKSKVIFIQPQSPSGFRGVAYLI